jgi:L-fuculose-phosphate aldolase
MKYNQENAMDYFEKYGEQIEDFLAVCRKLGESLFVTSHGGNLAWKLEENLILITPTKLNKGEITRKDLVFIDMDGRKVEGVQKPTGETPIYLGFFRERHDVRSVIHCHPPYTTAFTITEEKNWLMCPILPETVIEVGPVPLVPYAEPLTGDLADNFLPFLRKYNAFLMENHGLVIMSPESIKRTMQLVEILEMTSLSLLQALAIGDVKEISKEEIGNLDNTMQTRNLPLFGAPGENKSLLDLYYED